jgi:two-component system, chemotaxis family, chemotaxis protein CheY
MTKKILVIDDSFIARQQVINALKGGEFDVVEAVDGKDGLDKIGSESAVRLVICDVNMPTLNGIELLVRLRARDGAFPPFLMVTSEAQPEMIAEAKRQGAKAWMTKPFKAEHLLAAVRKLAE